MIEKRKSLVLIFILGIIIVVFFCLGIDNDSYALLDDSNYMGDYVLNPDWVEYMDLSEEEKVDYEV